jgi:hypothetical protein
LAGAAFFGVTLTGCFLLTPAIAGLFSTAEAIDCLLLARAAAWSEARLGDILAFPVALFFLLAAKLWALKDTLLFLCSSNPGLGFLSKPLDKLLAAFNALLDGAGDNRLPSALPLSLKAI